MTAFLHRNAFALCIIAALGLWLSAATRTSSFDDVPEIDRAEAQARIAAGARVIDVRGPESYARGHIDGAEHVPLTELRDGIPGRLASARDQPIVVYCGDGARSGPEATHLLTRAGFSKAANLKSGLEGWSAAGLPVKRG